jgi:hypothetical protein
MRFRWILVVGLLVVLYFADRKQMPIPETPYFLFLVVLFLYADLSKKLDRIESKVDDMGKGNSLTEHADQTY